MAFDHNTIKSMVQEGIDATQEARTSSEKCRDYYDGDGQWTAEERATLARRKQPVITDNRLKRKVDAMVGLEQRGRTDPVAYPREPGDEDAAATATKALRFVEETTGVDMKASAAFYNLCIEGYGGVEVVAKDNGDSYDVEVNRIRWEEYVYDPHSRELDFSDSGYDGVLKWMSADKAKTFLKPYWTGSDAEFDAMLDTSSSESGDTYQDRPQGTALSWYDKKQRRVRVGQIYYLCDGQWYMTMFTGRGEIINEVSPWLDVDGKPCNPNVMMTAYIDRENRRYGFLRDLLSQQDEINKRRSKMLHQLSSRQTWGAKGAIESITKMKSELAKPDGHVEVDFDAIPPERGIMPFNLIQNSDQIMGQAQLLQEATNAIDNLGPNAALMGQMSGAASGRAIMATQQAGMAELAPIYDSKRDWTERVYRMIWARIKQVWTGPKWIRVTGDMEAPQFIGINMPQPILDQMGQPMIDPMTGQPAIQRDAMGQPVVENAIGQIDVDIIIEQSPDYATLRAEQFEKLVELASSGMMQIPPAVIIKASDLPDKKELLEALNQPPPEPPPIVLETAQADLNVKKSQAMKNEASAQKDLASIGKVQADAAKAQADTQKTQVETRDKALDTTAKQVLAQNGVLVQ